MKASKIRKALSGIGLAALGTVVALLIVEIGLALSDIAPVRMLSGRSKWADRHAVFGWAYVPGAQITHVGYPMSTINSKGLREREYVYTKESGVFRILILGDSFTASLEVLLEQTWHEILESRLNQIQGSVRRVEVIAAGIQGWSTDQQLLYYLHEGHKYEPDLVILQFYENDVGGSSIDMNREGRRSGQDKPFCVADEDRLVPADPFRKKWRDASKTAGLGTRVKDFLRNHLRSYRLLASARGGREGSRQTRPFCWEYDGVPNQLLIYAPDYRNDWKAAWAVTSRIIEELKRETAKRGQRLAVAYFPARRQVLPTAWQATLERWPEAARLEWDLDKPNRFLGSLLSPMGVNYLDLTPTFRAFTAATGKALYIASDWHLNPEGHRRTAAWLQEWLVRKHLVP